MPIYLSDSFIDINATDDYQDGYLGIFLVANNQLYTPYDVLDGS